MRVLVVEDNRELALSVKKGIRAGEYFCRCSL